MDTDIRSQKKGKQRSWTLAQIQDGLRRFYAEHGRYPTSHEVDSYPYLPTARSIERSFGGLVAVRTQLGLSADQNDFRKGEHSAVRARTIAKRAHTTEHNVYEYLIEHFNKQFVHREYFFTDDRRTRADFFVFDTKQGFCIDVFYPATRRNLSGCLNNKLDKYSSVGGHVDYPVIFLQMNPDIDQKILDALVSAKEKKLGPNQYLMSWPAFTAFCVTRKPLQVR